MSSQHSAAKHPQVSRVDRGIPTESGEKDWVRAMKVIVWEWLRKMNVYDLLLETFPTLFTLNLHNNFMGLVLLLSPPY